MKEWFWLAVALGGVFLGLGALAGASWKAGHAAAQAACADEKRVAVTQAAASREAAERTVERSDDAAVLRALDHGGWLRPDAE